MRLETAQALINSIAGISKIAMEAHIKIAALETAIRKQNPNLYSVYEDELEAVKKNPPFSFRLEGIAALQSALVQD